MRSIKISRLSANKNLLLFIILSLQLLVIAYFGMKKVHFFVDEVYTLILSNGFFVKSASGLTVDNAFYKILDNNFWQSLLSVQSGQLFSFKSVWANQARDVHPPLYYSVIHAVSSLFPNCYSIWFGIIPNMIFFIGTQLLIYKIIKFTLKDSLLALVPCIIYGFSWGIINNTILIRMYTMLTFFAMFAFYMHFRLILALREKTPYYKLLAYCCIINILGFLTQYYFVIYATFLALGIYYFSIKYNKYRFIITYNLFMTICLAASWLIFPTLYKHIFLGYRGKGAAGNLISFENIDRFGRFIQLVDKDLFGGNIVYIMGIILGIFALILICKFNEKEYTADKIERIDNFDHEIEIWILSIIIFFVFIISKIAPYISSRYIYIIYPLIIIGFFKMSLFIFQILVKDGLAKKLCAVVLIAMCIVSALFTYDVNKIDYVNRRIANLESKSKNIPVIVVKNNKRMWPLPMYIMTMKNSKYSYITTLDKVNNIHKLNLGKKFICIYMNDKHDKSLGKTFMLKNFNPTKIKMLFSSQGKDTVVAYELQMPALDKENKND